MIIPLSFWDREIQLAHAPLGSGNEMVETAIHSAGILFFKCVVEVRAWKQNGDQIDYRWKSE